MQFSLKQFRELGVIRMFNVLLTIMVLMATPILAADINGTNGNDTLTGTANDDTINGLGGKDTITGLEGKDTIDGGAGNDRIDGGPGMDNILGGLGNDTILGGPDPDEIDGGDGNDKISGGDGNDDITGGRGNDTIRGGPGADVYNTSVNDGNDTYVIVAGDVPAATNEDVFCGGGSDKVFLYDIPEEYQQSANGFLKVTDPDTGGIYNIRTDPADNKRCETISHKSLVLLGLSADSLPIPDQTTGGDEKNTKVSDDVAVIEVEIFDLAGHKFLTREVSTSSSVISKELLGETSRYLANGVYLYVVRTRGRYGELTQLGVHKLIVIHK